MKRPKQIKSNRTLSHRLRGAWTALVICTAAMPTTTFAAGDPLGVVNNLSDFIFSAIRAIGVIILGWGGGAGWHERPEPRCKPADAGLFVPVRRSADYVCKGNSVPDRCSII